MVEVQCICKILTDPKSLRSFKSEWFTDYREHINYIQSFYQKYGRVPDKVTFIDKFRDFRCFDVQDPVQSLVDRLKEESRYKRVIPVYNRAYELIGAGKSDEACKLLVEKITALDRELSAGSPPVDLSDPEVKKGLYKQLKQKVTKFSTGRPELDDHFGGWNSKDYVVIFSRLGVGKSWLAEFFAYNLVKEGYRVGYYSGEMSAVEVSLRMDTFNTHESNRKMFNGNMSEGEYEKVADNFSSLPGKFFVITPEEVGGSATIEDLKRFIEGQNLDALFIDQISLMKRNPRLSTVEAIGALANELRILQSMTNVPFFIVSQQNRQSLQDKEAKSKDDLVATISYSDALGQNATLAFYLDYNLENKILTLNMVKSRRSRPQKFRYAWDIDRGLFKYIPMEDEGDAGDENSEGVTSSGPEIDNLDDYTNGEDPF